jgi:signal transduction histidine kinase
VLLSAIEITEEVAAREELERIDKMRDEFLSLASHELRTPLVPLVGYSDMIERIITRQLSDKKTPTADEKRLLDYVGKFRRQLSHMNRLIDDLFDVARLQNGKLTFDMKALDLSPVVERSIEEACMITDKQTIDFKGPNEQLCVMGDEDRIEQVVTNLLSNAIKYAPKSKLIEVRLRGEPGRHDSELPLGSAVLEVQDRGPGIPPEEIESIFSRFYRAPMGGTSTGEGLGLGLFITKAIVEQHGGTISVVSAVGKGTTFTVRLPLVNPEGAERRQTRKRRLNK